MGYECNHCAWCSKFYILNLQDKPDDRFCSPKCRTEWERYLDESNPYKEEGYFVHSDGLSHDD
jgi:hypothetical protein